MTTPAFSLRRQRMIRAILAASCIFNAAIVPVLLSAAMPQPVYRWTTLAGRVTLGDEDGPALDARFNHPRGLAADLNGNLYVADTGNHTIRKISPQGIVSTLAGKSGAAGAADGPGSTARFNAPRGIGVDANGNVYVADTGNHTIRKITPDGVVSTLAGQVGKSGSADGAATTAALFDAPDRLSVAPDGTVYLFNTGLRKISAGTVQTITIPAGTVDIWGYSLPVGIHDCPAIDGSGRLYFWSFSKTSYGQYVAFIAIMDQTGQFSAQPSFSDLGTGTGKHAIFNDAAGNIYATYYYLRLGSGGYHFSGGTVTSTGPATTAWFGTFDDDPTMPLGVAVDSSGRWYFTRESDSAITRDSAVYAGTPSGIRDGLGTRATFDDVSYLSLDSAGNIWVAEAQRTFAPSMSSPSHRSSSVVRKVSPTGEVRTVTLVGDYYFYHQPVGLAIDGADNIYLADSSSGFYRLYRSQSIGEPFPLVETSGWNYTQRHGLAVDSLGNFWTYSSYDTTRLAPTSQILRRSVSGDWTVVAGGTTAEIKDGQGESARIGRAYSLITDSGGNGVFLDATYDGSNVQVCFVRRITPLGEVTTLSRDLTVKTTAGGVTTTRAPASFALTKAGLFALVDSASVRLSDGQGNEVVIGGVPGVFGSSDGVGDKAGFLEPTAIRADARDNLYVMDQLGTVLRKGELLGYLPGITAQPQSLTVAAGGSAQFSVTAAATTPSPTYQWFLNNTAVSGATSNTLTLGLVSAAQAGDYTVVVSNELGSVTSTKATLTITGAPPPPPSGGGSGGGGAPSLWFGLAVLALSGLRAARARLHQTAGQAGE